MLRLLACMAIASTAETTFTSYYEVSQWRQQRTNGLEIDLDTATDGQEFEIVAGPAEDWFVLFCGAG